MILQIAPDVTGTLTAVIVALGLLLVALLGIATKALGYSKTGATQATAANKATNGVGPGEHRLYDMVTHIRDDMKHLTEAQLDFQERGWRHLPEDLSDATKLTLTIRQLQQAVEGAHAQRASIIADLAGLDRLIRAHDEWERSQKWALPGRPWSLHVEDTEEGDNR